MRKQNQIIAAGLLLAIGLQSAGAQTSNRYSVFGPPQPAQWEMQLAVGDPQAEVINGFYFYRKNQRQKTRFFSISELPAESGTGGSRTKISGGTVLFPYLNDDRLQLEIGATALRQSNQIIEEHILSRATLRWNRWLWIRSGLETKSIRVAVGHEPEGKSTASYAAIKIARGSWELTGAGGTTTATSDRKTLLGGGGYWKFPGNFFVFGGRLQGRDSAKSVRTLAIGRWVPFRPDGKSSMFYIWKHKKDYNFHLAGLFLGGNNEFVRPAAMGMTQGIFLSNLGLRENSDLRRRQLLAISDESRKTDYSIFVVVLDQGLEMIPGQINHIAVKTIRFFRVLNNVAALRTSKPLIGLFLTAETSPVYQPTSKIFKDVTVQYISGQLGVYLFDRHMLNLMIRPGENQWLAAYSLFAR